MDTLTILKKEQAKFQEKIDELETISSEDWAKDHERLNHEWDLTHANLMTLTEAIKEFEKNNK